MSSRPRVSIVLPAYNEEGNLGGVLDEANRLRDRYDLETIVVEGGSKDRTVQVAHEHGATKVISSSKKQGKGADFWTGVLAATGDYIIQIDSDHQFEPRDIPLAVDAMLAGADMAIATRFVKEADYKEDSVRQLNMFGNWLFSWVATILIGQRITDVLAGFKGFRKELIPFLQLRTSHFGYEGEVVIRAARAKKKIVEVPATHNKREAGVTNVHPFRDGALILGSMLEARFTPIPVHPDQYVPHPRDMTLPRVLLLTESLDPASGWGTLSRGIAESLRTAGIRLTVLTTDSMSEGPRLPSLHASRLSWMFAEFRLRRWIQSHPHDVVHVVVEPYAAFIHAFGNTPLILTICGTYVDPNAHGPRAGLFREALDRARRIIAISTFTATKIGEPWKAKTDVIPLGVSTSIALELFDAAPAHGSPLILGVGTLKPRKGYDRLIAGFAEFRKTHPNAELVIIGREDRPEVKNALIRRAVDLGVGEAVRFIGEASRAALLGWYRACDVFALTPVEDGGFEGFGLVYLEANVFGKPSAGSRHSGAESAIADGESGYLVNPNDPVDVARGLERALTRSSDTARMHAERMSWAKVASDHVKLYQQL